MKPNMCYLCKCGQASVRHVSEKVPKPYTYTDYFKWHEYELTSTLLFLSLRFTYKYLTIKVSKGVKIRNRYNQVAHLTQDTNGKVTNSKLDTTNESQEVSPFSAGEHKAHINRRAQRHGKHKTEQKHKRSTKEVPPWNGQ